MKYILKIGAAILILIALSWTLPYLFNHVDPWLGLGAVVVAVVLIAALFFNQIKSNLK